MQTWYYEVVSIDGDYANLRRIDIPSDDLLKYEMFQYELMEQ